MRFKQNVAALDFQPTAIILRLSLQGASVARDGKNRAHGQYLPAAVLPCVPCSTKVRVVDVVKCRRLLCSLYRCISSPLIKISSKMSFRCDRSTM